MEKRENSIIKSTKEYLVITVGLLLYAISWIVFLIPNKMVGGGVTGFSAILFYTTQIPISYTFFIINALLLLLALKILGKGFGAKTIYAIIMTSILLEFIPMVIPSDFIEIIALENGKLLTSIIGGALSGLGIGLTFTQGGSSGGTDIIALMINKYRNVSPGRIILYIDVVIIISSLMIPAQGSFGEQLATIVYGFLLISITGYTIDLVISGNRQSLQFFIFSEKYEQIAERVATMGRGVTLMDAQGWYSGNKGKVLLVIVRKSESSLLLRIIKECDKDAFISVGNVMGVYGRGFDNIKK